MFNNNKALVRGLMFLLVFSRSQAAGQKSRLTAAVRAKNTKPAVRDSVLWENPRDLSGRNLYYGPGGKEHEPHPGFTYLKEDLHGTNPKFDVHDADGVKWRVKLGPEARPETVASRLIWAVGYNTNEDYFLPELRVGDMQSLKRRHSNKLIGPGGLMHNARLKRMEEEKKEEQWAWADNPFSGTRELNGLRVMMALVNNWDLKDDNNGIYENKHHQSEGPAEYAVSDIGSSFGAPGIAWRFSRSKDNLAAYADSRFITKATPDYVDFRTPARPALWDCIAHPHDYAERSHMQWIGQRIPRADAKWIGGLLAQLSLEQIEDAFRAGGYSSQEVEAYTAVVQQRIEQLNRL